jgi:hypothetical protein
MKMTEAASKAQTNAAPLNRTAYSASLTSRKIVAALGTACASDESRIKRSENSGCTVHPAKGEWKQKVEVEGETEVKERAPPKNKMHRRRRTDCVRPTPHTSTSGRPGGQCEGVSGSQKMLSAAERI